MTPQVFIIILNWNDFQNTLLCIESLKSLTYPNYKILVVDNGSSNESVGILSAISNIELHCNKHNLGFTGGNNGGIKIAMANNADYVWLLNNDAIVAPDCLTKLVNTAENDKQIGLASPVIYDENDKTKIQHVVTRFDLSTLLMDGTNNIAKAKCWQTETPFGISLWGTALLISKQVIEKIGLLDERLFAYSEDVDYSIRSVNAGFKNVSVFDASIWHQGHIGHRKPHYYYYEVRNVYFLWKKHVGIKSFLKVAYWNFQKTKINIAKLKGHPQQIEACLLGVWDALRNVGGEYNPNRKAPWIIRFLMT